MSSTGGSFHGAVFNTLLEAQYGKDFDLAIIEMLTQLDDAEAFVRTDWSIIEKRIEAGELDARWWNRELAQIDLDEARARYWEVREAVKNDKGEREVYAIFAKHFERIVEWREIKKQSNPEVAMVAWLAGWLAEAGRRVPTYTELEALIEGLKAYGPALRDGASDDLKAQVGKSELTSSVRRAVSLRAQGEKERARRYAGELADAAKRIESENLFQVKTLRVDKLLAKSGFRLATKTDPSSPLFVLIDPKKRHGKM